MKFIISKDIRNNRPLSQLLIYFYLSTLLLLALGIQFEKFKWGLTFSRINEKLSGNEKLFIDPIDLQVLVSEIHIELFIYIFLAIMLLLVYQLAATKRKAQSSGGRLTSNASILFTLIVANSLAPLLAYFGVEIFVYVKVMAYPLLTAHLALLAVKNIAYLHRKPAK